jgi:hypothetical protein
VLTGKDERMEAGGRGRKAGARRTAAAQVLTSDRSTVLYRRKLFRRSAAVSAAPSITRSITKYTNKSELMRISRLFAGVRVFESSGL